MLDWIKVNKVFKKEKIKNRRLR